MTTIDWTIQTGLSCSVFRLILPIAFRWPCEKLVVNFKCDWSFLQHPQREPKMVGCVRSVHVAVCWQEEKKPILQGEGACEYDQLFGKSCAQSSSFRLRYTIECCWGSSNSTTLTGGYLYACWRKTEFASLVIWDRCPLGASALKKRASSTSFDASSLSNKVQRRTFLSF